MFNVGAGEALFILVAALLVLGPKRLPELARGLGKFLREFRRQTEEVRTVVEREFYRMDLDEPRAPSPTAMPHPKPALKPLSLPYRSGPELRPSLGAAGPVVAEVNPVEAAAGEPAAMSPAPVRTESSADGAESPAGESDDSRGKPEAGTDGV